MHDLRPDSIGDKGQLKNMIPEAGFIAPSLLKELVVKSETIEGYIGRVGGVAQPWRVSWLPALGRLRGKAC